MTTIGFQKQYMTDKDFVYIELFDNGTSREVLPEYELLEKWPLKIPVVSGSSFVTVDENENVIYDGAGATAAATKAAWMQVRAQRDGLIEAILWRAERYERQKAAGLPTTDTAAEYLEVLLYIQALRDITKQSDPYKIEWPDKPGALK